MNDFSHNYIVIQFDNIKDEYECYDDIRFQTFKNEKNNIINTFINIFCCIELYSNDLEYNLRLIIHDKLLVLDQDIQ